MDKKELFAGMEELRDLHDRICDELWHHPELGGHEEKSSDLFRKTLADEGFRIVNEPHLPYAFYAEYGSGSPVVAILGEYDALPNLSQKQKTTREPVAEGAPGHACGHNLLGTGAAIGAITVKRFLEKEKLPGTVRFYGCPEEELLSGKVKMAYYHMFDGCDLALTWHPMTSNIIYDNFFTALASVRYEFTGTPAHAAAAPWLGRSALDAVEIMNTGANYLREHVLDGCRIQYTTDACGAVPNIVPAHAKSWYFVRAAHMQDVMDILRRLELCAKGAAMMTETEVKSRIEYGCCEMTGVPTLTDLTYANMEEAPLPVYTEEEISYAREIQKSIAESSVNTQRRAYEEPADAVLGQRVVSRHKCDLMGNGGGSSDCGDVSQIMPMSFFTTTAWPLGGAPHTWQSCACTGTSIGRKGSFYAAEVFAGTCYDIFKDPSVVTKMKEEFAAQDRKPYEPMYYPEG